MKCILNRVKSGVNRIFTHLFVCFTQFSCIYGIISLQICNGIWICNSIADLKWLLSLLKWGKYVE